MIRYVLLSLLFAVLVGCAVTGSQQENFELVRIGMTAQQVERRLGPIEWRHLTYDRIEKGGSAHHLEFEDGKLGNSYQVVEKGRDAEPEATKRGTTIAEVIAIMGPPATNCAMFPFDDAKTWTNAGYRICFSNGRVSSKSIVEIPRLPRH